MSHAQILVKVNAPVDVWIADVVMALNEFPKVYTTQSCQGDDPEPGDDPRTGPDGHAFVWFRHDGTLYEAADFFVWLNNRIGVAGVTLYAEVAGESLGFRLRIRRRAIVELGERLREVVRDSGKS